MINKPLKKCVTAASPGPGRCSDGRHGCVLNEAVKFVVDGDDAALIVIAIGHYLSLLL
jgi:hypothetical protein